MENTSGQGKLAVVPDKIKKWNWGAFWLSWIWGLGNKVYISLLSLIPYAGIIMMFVLGAKGSEWAWRRKKWNDIEHFKKVQRIWAYWGWGIIIVPFFLGFLAAIITPILRK